MVLALLALLVLGGLFFALRPDPAAGPREQTFDVAVEEGAMTPSEISVGEGDEVTLRITSESPVGVHVHGYDLEEERS